MFARRLSSSSPTARPAQRPSSSTPTRITPGLPCAGKSFAKAQMLLRIFSAAEFDSDSAGRCRAGCRPQPLRIFSAAELDSDRLRSTRSDSRSTIIAASSASLYPLDGTPQQYRRHWPATEDFGLDAGRRPTSLCSWEPGASGASRIKQMGESRLVRGRARTPRGRSASGCRTTPQESGPTAWARRPLSRGPVARRLVRPG